MVAEARASFLSRRAPEISKGPVGSYHDGTTFVPGREKSEEQFSSLLASQIAQFTDEQMGL